MQALMGGRDFCALLQQLRDAAPALEPQEVPTLHAFSALAAELHPVAVAEAGALHADFVSFSLAHQKGKEDVHDRSCLADVYWVMVGSRSAVLDGVLHRHMACTGVRWCIFILESRLNGTLDGSVLA
jgi:hypothetical protein